MLVQNATGCKMCGGVGGAEHEQDCICNRLHANSERAEPLVLAVIRMYERCGQLPLLIGQDDPDWFDRA